MQIHANLQRVLILLSTIVVVTDCCSSKIISLKEHNLKMLYQQKQLQEQHSAMKAQQPIQMPQKIPQHVELATETNFGKIANSSNNDDDNKQNKSIIYTTVDTFINMKQFSTTTEDSELAQKTVNENDTQSADAYEEREAKFHMLDLYYTIMRECSGQYLTDFCLNRGRCFRYPVGNHSFFSCECADGYVGERCESKSIYDYYVPQRVKRSTHILTARVFFSFPTLIAISVLHVILGLFVVLRSPAHQQRTVDAVTFKHLSGEEAATVTAVIA